tara:strand:+ start:6804 stop:6953 length:150 start_codon:yes stop_codon:yes gene_type:complete
MAKRAAFGSQVYAPIKKTRRRFCKPPLNHRKKLTPSESRMKKAGSNAKH